MKDNKNKACGCPPEPTYLLSERAARLKWPATEGRVSVDLVEPWVTWVLVFFLALGWAVSGSPVAASERISTSVVSHSGKYIVEYVTQPSPIPPNEMFEMTVSVRERLKKTSANNVSLEIRAGMSIHNHGMNTSPVVERMKDRRFRVRGMLFHMTGPWELVFVIKRGIIVDKAEQLVHVQ
ncbi:MAG: hypothetical protein QNK18_18835 [Gammaproteobacteria bacterium]|nr:hypothetical protein [Gammaproteobacteria bacterium]